MMQTQGEVQFNFGKRLQDDFFEFEMRFLFRENFSGKSDKLLSGMG